VKNISIILNVVLTIAVIYLYYLHFAGNKQAVPTTSVSDSASVHVPVQPKEIKDSKIVYVNADTLLAKYDYIKDIKAETEGRQSRLENAYREKGEKLQRDYAELQQKAQSGALSSDQAKVAEQQMMTRKAELDGMEKQLRDLAEETQRKSQMLQDKVNKFLREYNKGGQYQYILSYASTGGSVLLGSDKLDVTREILDGLNAQYKEEKNSKKK